MLTIVSWSAYTISISGLSCNATICWSGNSEKFERQVMISAETYEDNWDAASSMVGVLLMPSYHHITFSGSPNRFWVANDLALYVMLSGKMRYPPCLPWITYNARSFEI